MTTETVTKVVVCVPAYNEEKTIAKVLVRASRHVDRVIVVDDSSEDDTGAIAEKLGAIVIRHSRNLGKGAAVRDVFDWAKKNDIPSLSATHLSTRSYCSEGYSLRSPQSSYSS